MTRAKLLLGPLTLCLLTAAAAVGCRHDSPTARAPSTPEAAQPHAAAAAVVFGQAAAPFQSPPILQGTADIAAIVEKTKATVVNITTSSRPRPSSSEGLDAFEFFFGQPFGGNGTPPGFNPFGGRSQARRSLGSGFIVDASGYVLTNHHVVENADDITVKLWDGRELKATVAGKDPKLDVAMLKLENAGLLPAVVLGDSDRLRVGEYVVAMGNPFGLGSTVTMGIVSAKDRTIGAGPYDDFIQTDASINPGNSGGPLFNLLGEVIGMNTAIHAQGQGIGFAIPANLMKDVVVQLRETGHVTRGKLGLVFQPMTEQIARALGRSGTTGALVAEIEQGGPADKAGVRSGDIVIKVGDAEVTEATQLPRLVARHKPGTAVAVTLLRQGKEQTVHVTLGAMGDEDSAPSKAPSPGKTDGPSDHGLRLQATQGGVRVTSVTGEAAQSLRPGDVIRQVDGRVVATPPQVTAALDQASKDKRPALVMVRRGDRVLFTTLDPSKK